MTEAEEEGAEEVSLFADLDRPTVVYIYGAGSADVNFDKIEKIVFKNEKIGLAMKAFRTVKISPDQAEEDALIGGEGKTVPRMLVIDPVKERIKVLETKKIKVSSLYNAMKGAAKNYYKENLDKQVKAHLKILNERDKLHNEMKVLQEKENRLADDGKSAEKKIKKIKKERQEIEKAIEELTAEERTLWKLTPKHAEKAA